MLDDHPGHRAREVSIVRNPCSATLCYPHETQNLNEILRCRHDSNVRRPCRSRPVRTLMHRIRPTWQLRSRRRIASSVRGVRDADDSSSIEWTGCALMGVVNTTPDSFSDGGLFLTEAAAIAHARRLVADGAFVVDVGGESTRPGADEVGLDEELHRTIPVIERIAADGEVLISVDTRKPPVAAAAIAAGAHIVNDVGGLRLPAMVELCAAAGVPAIVMHMRGDPGDMQQNPQYDDVVGEVVQWLLEHADTALAQGVPSVMVDPGIGFGKTLAHNVALLRALPLTDRFPTLIGASRKQSILQMASLAPSTDRDVGSIAAHLFAARHGAAMVRVHDVAGHRQAFAVETYLTTDSPDDVTDTAMYSAADLIHRRA